MKHIETKKPKQKFWKTMDNILQEFLKNTLWELLIFIVRIVWNWYGVTILILLTTLSLGLLSWLTIPITAPAYIVALTFIVIIIGVVLFQRIQVSSKRRKKTYSELLWKISKDNTVMGPYCPKCKCKDKMNIIYDQDSNTKNVIFGKEPEYLYTSPCGYQVKLNKSSSTLIMEIQKKNYNLET
jgi:hypothetical protein